MNSRRSLAIILVILGLITRFWNLSSPREVVFDEVHFGKFVTSYCCSGERFFDIHPPHAKLIIAGTARLLGYNGDFPFDHIGQPYDNTNPWPLRFAPALAGSLMPVTIFWILLLLGASAPMAFFGGLLLTFDTAQIIQSRIIALDSILLLATFGSLALFLAATKKEGSMRFILLMLAGCAAGVAVGTKFTGLAALALLGFGIFYLLFRAKNAEERFNWFWGGVIILLSAFIIYSAGWLLHYSLLTLPGDGDAWQVPSGNIVSDTIAMHKIMLDANYNLKATHPYMSPWWTWPGMRRPVFYWQGDNAYMYFIGNPAIWWSASVLFLAAIASYILSLVLKHKIKNPESVTLLVLGYGIAFAPLVRVPRALFLYHYLTPLVFSLLLALFWLDREVFTDKQKESRQLFYGTAFFIVFIVFILFSPYSYGFAIPDSWHALLYWFPTWR